MQELIKLIVGSFLQLVKVVKMFTAVYNNHRVIKS